MTLDLAGCRVAFRVCDPRLLRRLRRRYRLFLSGGRPGLTIDVLPFGPARTRRPRPFQPAVRDLGARWSFSRGDARCELDLSVGRGRLEVWPNPWSFDAALRVIFARLLADRGAFFLHAAALSDGKRLVLFPGRSGAGKTTLAAACAAERPLGDELVAVRRKGRGFEALSTPFWGNGRQAERRGAGQVSAVAFLERTRQPRVRPLPSAEAVRRASQCLVWFGGSDESLRRVWGETVELVRRSPTVAVGFHKRQSPWKLLVRSQNL